MPPRGDIIKTSLSHLIQFRIPYNIDCYFLVWAICWSILFIFPLWNESKAYIWNV